MQFIAASSQVPHSHKQIGHTLYSTTGTVVYHRTHVMGLFTTYPTQYSELRPVPGGGGGGDRPDPLAKHVVWGQSVELLGHFFWEFNRKNKVP